MDYSTLLGAIVFICLIVFLCVLVAWSVMLGAKRDQRVKDYVNSLDEHDKAVIARYQAEARVFYKDIVKGKDNEDK